MPSDFNSRIADPRFVRWISGTVSSSSSFMYAIFV